MSSRSRQTALEMTVTTALGLPDGIYFQGPRFDLSEGHRRPGNAFDWNVTHLSPQLEPLMQGTVFNHRLEKEPLLCLAARGAWALWNDNTPFADSDEYTGLAIEVLYGEFTTSFIIVEVDARGSTYTGSSLDQLRLARKTADCLQRRDPRHWVRAVLNELAFGDVKPLPHATSGGEPRKLPGCWSHGNASRFDDRLNREGLLLNHWSHSPY